MFNRIKFRIFVFSFLLFIGLIFFYFYSFSFVLASMVAIFIFLVGIIFFSFQILFREYSVYTCFICNRTWRYHWLRRSWYSCEKTFISCPVCGNSQLRYSRDKRLKVSEIPLKKVEGREQWKSWKRSCLLLVGFLRFIAPVWLFIVIYLETKELF